MTLEWMSGRPHQGVWIVPSAMEQVPWKGLGQGLNAIHLILPEDHADFRYRVDGDDSVRIMMKRSHLRGPSGAHVSSDWDSTQMLGRPGSPLGRSTVILRDQ